MPEIQPVSDFLESMQLEELPIVSITIPMHNEVANIRRCVESILEQTYPTERLEVVVVDGISDDGSRDILEQLSREYENVHFHDNPLRITPRALNIGIQKSSGDVIIILGAHTRINPDFIERNIRLMLERGEVCTGGTQINVGDTWLQQAIGIGMGSPFGIPTAPYRFEKKQRYVDTVVYAAYRREVLAEVGLFEEDIHIAEDAELNWRIRQANHKILFSPEIISYYYPRPSFPKLFKQFFNYGLMRVNVVKKHPDAFRILHLAPALAIFSGATLAALSFVHVAFFYTLLACLGLYLGGITVGGVICSAKEGFKYFPALPAVFSTLHFGFGTGYIFGLFKSQKWGGTIPGWVERCLIFGSDYLAINGAFAAWMAIRAHLGLFAETDFSRSFYYSNIIFLYWFFIFIYSGLYKTWKATSRLDELVHIVKSIFWGVVIIFLITFDLDRDLANPLPMSRALIISYLGLLVAFVGFGRIGLITFQRKLLELGVGLRRTLIVGWGETAYGLFEKLGKYPALGYRVIGFATSGSVNGETDFRGVPLVGSIQNMDELVKRHKIEEILIALENEDRSQLYDVITATDGLPVQLKILPDLYSIMTGQARTNQIYGVPLVEILPQPVAEWERKTKRLIDVFVSTTVLFVGMPLWLLISLLIKLDSKGPVFYIQDRVGLNGHIFRIFKFRSMIANAEKDTGPRWATKNDDRITRTGSWIRKMRFDEVPQFINVLKGDMSLIGPRPERPYFVEIFKKEIPFYARRLRVRPGISGWGQIKGDYDSTINDVKQKLQYDIFYLENMSLLMDLKILLNTIYVVLRGKGR